MTTVYIDELLAVNALADYLLLRSAAELRGLPRRRGRCALGAVLGGVYAALCVLPGLGWLASPLAALAVSGLMALCAFGGDVGLWRSWACLLALSALFGGAVLAVCLLTGEQGWPLSARQLLCALGLLYALLRLGLGRVLEKRQRQIHAVRVTLSGRSAAFPALRDTGNALRDPISGRAVLIAERGALAPLFPLPLPEGEGAELLRALGHEGAGRWRLVPYRSVGGSGLLACFLPEEILVDDAPADLLVGVSPRPFTEDGEFKAVL